MGRLNVPPTANPSTNGRGAPASGGPGPETKADIDGALNSNPGPGEKRNAGGGSNMGFNSGELHKALP